MSPEFRVLAVSVLALVAAPFSHAQQMSELRRSIARINCTAQEPNYRVPWQPGPTPSGSGTGWIVSKDRLMTNAHVVSNAQFITLERENDPKKYTATVEHIAHDCDLALLKVDDAAFFKNTKPLAVGGIPEIQSTVQVIGYPVGGERMSLTQGVVSRIDFLTYSHSVMDQHLTIQVDAAINPGNSGGPVLQGGKVVGVAFQGYSGAVAQNVGYMIPTPVINHFLKDIADGKYDRYVDLSINTFNLQNPAMRRALELPDDDRGVMVSAVAEAGPCHGFVEVGDVVLAIDKLPVSSDGMVEFQGQRVMMAEVAERKFVGDKVSLTVLRKGERKDLEVPFKQAWPFTMQANQYEQRPQYVVFGGLLFQPLNRNTYSAYNFSNPRVGYYFDFFMDRELYRDRPEVVVLANILADPVNTYLNDFKEGIVDKVNGVAIKNLKGLAEELAKPNEFQVIELLGAGRPIVLERAAVEAARGRIKERYRIPEEQFLGEENEAAK